MHKLAKAVTLLIGLYVVIDIVYFLKIVIGQAVFSLDKLWSLPSNFLFAILNFIIPGLRYVAPMLGIFVVAFLAVLLFERFEKRKTAAKEILFYLFVPSTIIWFLTWVFVQIGIL